MEITTGHGKEFQEFIKSRLEFHKTLKDCIMCGTAHNNEGAFCSECLAAQGEAQADMEAGELYILTDTGK